MKVLVTGGSGQIGSALLRRAPASWELVAPSSQIFDLSSDSSIRSFIRDFRPAWVINAAAYTDVEKAESEPELAGRINGEAPGIIAREVARVGGRLLQVSTDYVFDGKDASPYQSGARCNPLSVYGESKLAGEKAVLDTDLVVRTGWIYGTTGRNFFKVIFERMRSGEALRVVDDQFGSPTWTTSLAGALIELVEAGSSGIHHFTDRGRASWHDFAVEIGRAGCELGLLPAVPEVIPVASTEYETIAERPANSVLNCEMTYKELSQLPPVWQDNLRRVLTDYRAAN